MEDFDWMTSIVKLSSFEILRDYLQKSAISIYYTSSKFAHYITTEFDGKYSQHPLIRTLTGPKNLVELANVRIIESCDKSSSRTPEWKKNTRNCLLGCVSSLNKKRVHFYRIFSRRR